MIAHVCVRPADPPGLPLRVLSAKEIQGAPLTGIDWSTEVSSAQVKGAILLAGLVADGATTVRESAQTRDHTER